MTALPAHVAVVAGHRVRAEELHLGLLRREVAEAVGDELVVEVAFEVDEEAVVAEVALRRARLELGDVDGARRELLQDREQRARAVLALEAHDRRLVVAGRRGNAVAHDHEAGLVLGVVLDLAGQDLEPGVGRALARCRSTPSPLASTSPPAAPPRRWSWPPPGSRRAGASAIHIRVWPSGFGCDTTVVMSASFVPGARAQVERDREVDLALHQQLGVEREGVERDRDRALDRVLDGHDAEVDLAASRPR